MTQLSNRAIQSYLLSGEIVIDPLLTPVQPASVDLRLGPSFSALQRGLFDPAKQASPEVTACEGTYYLLGPDQFVLAVTQEWIEIPGFLSGVVTGKSSLARIGLQVEAAGYVDAGWKGRLTLEIKNLGPMLVALRAGMPICQIRFEYLSEVPEHLYGDPVLGSHYQGSTGPVSAVFSPLPLRDMAVGSKPLSEGTSTRM
jgi:dCTP deaminase